MVTGRRSVDRCTVAGRSEARGTVLVRLAVLGMALGLALALVLVVHGAVPAGAHASLQSTRPGADELLTTAPTEIRLTFDEPVEIALGGVEVLSPEGDRV